MNIEPWFDSFPELIKCFLTVISGLTSLCVASTKLLRQYNRLRRTWKNASTPPKRETQKKNKARNDFPHSPEIE